MLTDALAQRSVNRSSTQQKRFHPHSIYVFEPATLGFPAVGDNRISLPVQARSGYWLGSAATYPLLTAAIDASHARDNPTSAWERSICAGEPYLTLC